LLFARLLELELAICDATDSERLCKTFMSEDRVLLKALFPVIGNSGKTTGFLEKELPFKNPFDDILKSLK
jgi:hypothetical protein